MRDGTREPDGRRGRAGSFGDEALAGIRSATLGRGTVAGSETERRRGGRRARTDQQVAALHQKRAFSDTKNWRGAARSSVCAVPVGSAFEKPLEPIVEM